MLGNIFLRFFWYFFRIKEKTAKTLKEKYDQMFTLYRFLPLLVHDLVPCGNDIWIFLLEYFDLVAYLLSPSFSEADYSILGVLIRWCVSFPWFFLHCSPYEHPSVLDEHLSLFVELFPDSSVVFKQHRLIHYPNVLRASGPFVYQSVLRFERKHQFFKRLTHNICNFKIYVRV